jgi:glutamate---cysteine ligase / carboxylate-amine ligase
MGTGLCGPGAVARRRRPRPAREAIIEAMTVGVEEEFLVVDAGTGALVPRSHDLLLAAEPVLGEHVAPELNLCQIEVDSVVCTTLDEVAADLTRLRRGLAAAGGPLGVAIAALGTHPSSSWRDQQVNPHRERYLEMERRYQIVCRQQVICGCHVHVGIDDPELAIEVTNRARPWLPVLLALTANSPFWSGLDTGFASYRTEVWQRWPTAGMPPLLGSRAEYDRLVAELLAVEAIEDPTFLYWYIRPSARYATVEFRVCDVCLTPDDATAVAGIVRALAWTCARDAVAGNPGSTRSRDALEAAMWRAARYGLSGELVDPVVPGTTPAAAAVAALLDHVRDGLEAHGDAVVVPELVAAILARGNGADQQRRARAHRGDHLDVVDLVVARTVPS